MVVCRRQVPYERVHARQQPRDTVRVPGDEVIGHGVEEHVSPARGDACCKGHAVAGAAVRGDVDPHGGACSPVAHVRNALAADPALECEHDPAPGRVEPGLVRVRGATAAAQLALVRVDTLAGGLPALEPVDDDVPVGTVRVRPGHEVGGPRAEGDDLPVSGDVGLEARPVSGHAGARAADADRRALGAEPYVHVLQVRVAANEAGLRDEHDPEPVGRDGRVEAAAIGLPLARRDAHARRRSRRHVAQEDVGHPVRVAGDEGRGAGAEDHEVSVGRYVDAETADPVALPLN